MGALDARLSAAVERRGRRIEMLKALWLEVANLRWLFRLHRRMLTPLRRVSPVSCFAEHRKGGRYDWRWRRRRQ
jgi:hypothetical protein